MIGETVEHPQYGRGKITAIYRNGSEWLVRFDSGLRFRRPRREFVGQQELVLAPAAPLPVLDAQPMAPSQYQARQLLEALRVGIAPAQHIKELTIGLESERASLAEGLVSAHQAGGAVRAVIGEYGYGKTHLVELDGSASAGTKFHRGHHQPGPGRGAGPPGHCRLHQPAARLALPGQRRARPGALDRQGHRHAQVA